MLKRLKVWNKKWMHKWVSFSLAMLANFILKSILKTCSLQVEGVERFCEIAANHKCILMLWHNRISLTPFILSRYAPSFIYAAFISASKDADILDCLAKRYKIAKTIRVHHHSRYQALRKLIESVEERKHIVIITPDGPRGPRYALKPGIALTALETEAYVVTLNWEADSYWQLPTWDSLRIPKPFTTLKISFSEGVQFRADDKVELEKAKEVLKNTLPEF
jgi:lysophospholipid acyltransferase (LPLAT)-like uncharacterized protein